MWRINQTNSTRTETHKKNSAARNSVNEFPAIVFILHGFYCVYVFCILVVFFLAAVVVVHLGHDIQDFKLVFVFNCNCSGIVNFHKNKESYFC